MNLPATFEQMIESKYLKKEDVIPDKLFTIRSFEHVNAAGENQPPEMKFAMYFYEHEKAMLLNSTNIQLLKMALGVNGPAEAIGRKIVAFNDPTVSYGGKLVGGIRLRAPRNLRPEPQYAPQQQYAPNQYAPQPQQQFPQPQQQFPAQQAYAPSPQDRGPANVAHVDTFEDDIPF